MAVSVSQLLYSSAWGYLEYLSTVTSIYVSLLLFVNGPAKSFWISSSGSESGGNFVCLFFGIMVLDGFTCFGALFASLR